MRGGKRSGSGRPKGSVSAATRKRKEIAEQALSQGKTPLEVMLEAMRAAYEQGGAIAAFVFAKDAAPYMHPKLSAVDADVTHDVSDTLSDLMKAIDGKSRGLPGRSVE